MTDYAYPNSRARGLRRARASALRITSGARAIGAGVPSREELAYCVVDASGDVGVRGNEVVSVVWNIWDSCPKQWISGCDEHAIQVGEEGPVQEKGIVRQREEADVRGRLSDSMGDEDHIGDVRGPYPYVLGAASNPTLNQVSEHDVVGDRAFRRHVRFDRSSHF